MSKGLVMFLVTVLLALLAVLLVMAVSALLFGDSFLTDAMAEIGSFIKNSIK